MLAPDLRGAPSARDVPSSRPQPQALVGVPLGRSTLRGHTASEHRPPTSELWKQLLLDGLSISLFLQEINSPHEVNGGSRQAAFTSSLSGLRLRSWR